MEFMSVRVTRALAGGLATEDGVPTAELAATRRRLEVPLRRTHHNHKVTFRRNTETPCSPGGPPANISRFLLGGCRRMLRNYILWLSTNPRVTDAFARQGMRRGFARRFV